MLRRMGQRLNQWRRLEQHTRLFVYTRQLLCACAHMATMLGACTRRSFSPVQLTWGVIQGAPLFLHSGTSGMTSVHSWQFTYWYWNIVWHPVNNHWPPLYVDDIIIIGWKDGLEEVKTAKFNIKDLGNWTIFSGSRLINIHRTQFGLVNQVTYSKRSTPVSNTSKLTKAGCVCGPEGVSVCDWKFAVSLCLYTARHFICCEQFGQIHPRRSTG